MNGGSSEPDRDDRASGPAPQPGHAGNAREPAAQAGGASDGNRLEGRYRRLLAWYPAEHRRKHEREMLDVLMSGARSGQRGPGPAEAANLIWGAIRVRLRPGLDSAADPGWRDALATVSVVLPVCFLLFYAGQFATLATLADAGRVLPVMAIALAAPLALTALVLLRLRRIAAIAAAGLLVWAVGAGLTPAAWHVTTVRFSAASFGFLFGHQIPTLLANYGFLLGLEIAALLASPGPRRGLTIIGRRYLILAALAAAVAGAGDELSYPHPPLRIVPVGLIVVVAIGMAVASPLSRRVGVLLAIPLSYALTVALGALSYSLAGGIATWLPSMIIAGLVIVAARRSARAKPSAQDS